MVLRLRELRKARHLTLQQVGAHLDKSHATISRWENGQIPVLSTHLLKLAALYGVHVWELWQEDATPDAHDEQDAQASTA